MQRYNHEEVRSVAIFKFDTTDDKAEENQSDRNQREIINFIKTDMGIQI